MSVLLAILILVAIVIVLSVRRRAKLRPRLTLPSDPTGVSRQTQQRLLNLLNGDRKGAERLIISARQRNPGKTENWYWEKVIFDLERDRRI